MPSPDDIILESGNWTFFAVTYNNTNGNETIYQSRTNISNIVGLPIPTGVTQALTDAGGNISTVNNITFGTNALVGGFPSGSSFNGSLDFFKAYNRTLSQAELENIYWNNGELTRPIETTQLSTNGVNLILNDGTLLIQKTNVTYHSTDNTGATLINVQNISANCKYYSAFQDSKNFTYIGCNDTIYWSPPTGNSYNLTNFSLRWTMPFFDNYFWMEHSLSESTDGNYLFFGTYGFMDDTTKHHSPYIYRTSDQFKTATLVFNGSDAGHPALKHVHFVKVDPYTGYVYASFGDKEYGEYNDKMIVRSTNNGDTWSILQTGDDFGYSFQPTTLLFTQDYRIYGEDIATGQSKIFRTKDDINYETVYIPEFAGWWYTATKDNKGVLYMSEYNLPNPIIIASQDNGTTWYVARKYENIGFGGGIYDLSNVHSQSDYFYFKGLGSEQSIRAKTLDAVDDPVWDYQFNENQGTVAYNSGSNGWNGSIIGPSWNNDGVIVTKFMSSPVVSILSGLLLYPASLLFNYLVSVTYPTTDYIRLNNTNSTGNYSIDLGRTSTLLSALVYNINGSIFGSADISKNNGSMNFTVKSRNEAIILDRFNITEGFSRNYNPVWISLSSSSVRIISSNITTSLKNVSSMFTVTTSPDSPKFISNLSDVKTFSSSEYIYSSNRLIINISNIINGTNTLYLDTASPRLSLIVPTNNQYFLGEFPMSVLINFSVTEPNLQSCWYSLDNSPNVSVSCLQGSNDFTVQILAEGHHNISVYSNDSDGNFNQTMVNFSNFRYSNDPTGGGSGEWFPGGYYQYNSTIVCKDVYYFIIGHLQSDGKVSYTIENLESLKNDLTLKLKEGISSYVIEEYINHFKDLCNYSEYSIPTKEDVLPIAYPSYAEECPFTEGGFMSLSIPFFKIVVGEKPCEKYSVWKYVFKFEENDQGVYEIVGIRLYLILFTILAVIGILIAVNLGRISKKLK